MDGRPLLAAGILPAVAYLGLLLIAPLGLLVAYSVWKADFFSVTRTFTPENYVRLLGSPLFLGILARTLVTALAASVIATLVAYVMAYAIVFRLGRWGPRVLVLVMASLLSSYVVRLFALTTILGTNGILNSVLLGLGLVDAPISWLLYGYPAILITLVYVYLPIAVLPIVAGLQGIDQRLLEASRDLGRGRAGTFLLVTLPLSARGLRTAFAFTFMLAAADYVAPRLVGGMDGQMIGAVIADQFGGASNYPFGATLAVAMILGFALVLGACALLERAAVALARPLVGRLGVVDSAIPALPLAQAVTIAALVFLFAPLVTVLVFSFNDSPNPGLPFVGFTLRWYAEVLSSPEFHRVLFTSFQVAGICLAGGLVLGVPAALALARRDFALRPAAHLLTLGPMVVPGVVIGVALLAAYVTLGIRLGRLATAAAHVMLVLPFVVQVIRTRLAGLDPQLDEAARDLGSGPWRALRTVTLPILLPALLGAGVLAVAISLDELLVTSFTIGRDATIPTWIASQMRVGLSPALNAVAILMMVGLLALIGAAGLALRARGRWREGARG